jgi:hypothetical protein
MIRPDQAYPIKMRIPPVKPGIAGEHNSLIDDGSIQNSMIFIGTAISRQTGTGIPDEN